MKLLPEMKGLSLHILLFFNRGHYKPEVFIKEIKHQEFPLYDMPINYELLYEEDAEPETIPHGVNPTNARSQPEFIQVPPGGRGEDVVINRISTTTQPRVLNVTLGGEPKTEVVAPTATVLDADRANDKLKVLEKRLMAIEGGSSYEFGDAAGLCLVPDVIISPKFKVPDFEKYKGTTCPKSHLTMYCRKMAAHVHNEKLLIHCFQDSLGGMSLNWYMHLEPTRISSWKDLVDAFLKQYKYNMDMAPDRMQLQNMAKKSSKTFREYAQRWRELATQVEPPLYEKEMITMFIETLQAPFYEHVLGSISSNFSDIVTIGERIEHGLKTGKIAQGSPATTGAKKHAFNPDKKKEGEVQAASTAPYWGGYRPQYLPNYRPSSTYVANVMSGYSQNTPRPPTAYRSPVIANNAFQPNVGSQSSTQAQSPGYGQKNNNSRGKVVNFTPIPMTYTELLPDLLKSALVVICPARIIQPPYSRYYDVNAKCEYHGGEVGHSTENCQALKYKVQSLLDSGWHTFQEQKASVENNPSTVHANASTSANVDQVAVIEQRRGGQSFNHVHFQKSIVYDFLF